MALNDPYVAYLDQPEPDSRGCISKSEKLQRCNINAKMRKATAAGEACYSIIARRFAAADSTCSMGQHGHAMLQRKEQDGSQPAGQPCSPDLAALDAQIAKVQLVLFLQLALEGC